MQVQKAFGSGGRAIVTNMWRTVRFALGGVVLERRLVHVVEDQAADLNVESPVGRALLTARAGDVVTVRAPGGDVVVKVLGIS